MIRQPPFVFLFVPLLVLCILGCNPRTSLVVNGPTGSMTVVLKEDGADLATARRLAKEAIEQFVEENQRFPSLEELSRLEVSMEFYGEKHLGGITDVVSVTVEEK